MGKVSRTGQCPGKGLDDSCDNLILEGEDVDQVTVEAVAPNVGVAGGVDELRVDAQTVELWPILGDAA